LSQCVFVWPDAWSGICICTTHAPSFCSACIVSHPIPLPSPPSSAQTLDQELLARRQAELLEKEGSGCKVLLANDMVDDLSRMYRLFSRITDGLVPVAEIFKVRVVLVVLFVYFATYGLVPIR